MVDRRQEDAGERIRKLTLANEILERMVCTLLVAFLEREKSALQQIAAEIDRYRPS
jgi:hypothetical protein